MALAYPSARADTHVLHFAFHRLHGGRGGCVLQASKHLQASTRGGGGVLTVMHARSLKAIDPRIPTVPERERGV